MLRIRNIIFIFYYFLWNSFAVVAFLPTFLIPCDGPVFYAARIWSKGVLFGARLILNIRLQIVGGDNLKHALNLAENSKKKGLIVASQHQSAFETVVFFAVLPKPVFALKREVIWIPFMGLYPIRMGCISLKRAAGNRAIRKLIRDSGKILKNTNKQLVLFPEGTRVPAGKKMKLRNGLYAIYNEHQPFVIPMKLNSGKLWPRDSFFKKPGKIIFEFGAVLEQNLEKNDFNHQIYSFYHD